MKYVKRFGVFAAAVAAVFVGLAPASAGTSSTTLAVAGAIEINGGLYVGGTCAGATAGGQPGAGACALASSGSATGSCALWSGNTNGTITRTLGTTENYKVALTVVLTGNVVHVVGTAQDSTGAFKTVVGGGIAEPVSGSAGCLVDQGLQARYTWVGALEIVG